MKGCSELRLQNIGAIIRLADFCVLRNVPATNKKLPQITPPETIEFKNIYYSKLKCLAAGKNLEKTAENIQKQHQKKLRTIKNRRKYQPLGR